MADKKKLMDEATQGFLSDIHSNHSAVKLAFDERVNWVLGISAILIGLTLDKTMQGPGYAIIFISASLAFLFSLLIFEPPSLFFKQNHNNKSIMHYKAFENDSQEILAKKLSDASDSPDEIFRQYAGELQNMVQRNIRFKARMIKYPVYILFWGTLLGLILISFAY